MVVLRGSSSHSAFTRIVVRMSRVAIFLVLTLCGIALANKPAPVVHHAQPHAAHSPSALPARAANHAVQPKLIPALRSYPKSVLELTTLEGVEYFFNNKQKFTWVEAMSFCRAHGMDLLGIETEAEWNRIKQHLDSKQWKLDKRNEVLWTSGTKIGSANYRWMQSSTPMTFTKWAPNEPNEAKYGCLVIHQRAWQDWPCANDGEKTYRAGFICEVPPATP